jgi:hypothetical protein
MGISTRHLGALAIAAIGFLAADSTDAAWYSDGLYTYEVQVHYTNYGSRTGYWAERGTFSSEAQAKDFYFYLLMLGEKGSLDDYYPGARGFLADDVRLVRFSNYESNSYGEEWISGDYWRSLKPIGTFPYAVYGN